jgi:hypothetical protein
MRRMKEDPKTIERVSKIVFGRIYPMYVTKVERKGRTKAELDEVLRWLTGYTQKGLDAEIKNETGLADFIGKAPKLNPSRTLITGTVCGVRVEDIKNAFMREVRYMDKLVDELAKGRAMEKILRKPA